MGEFFRGWKRKIGVVTLMMALLFMLGWIRSFHIQDTFVFACENNQSTCELITFPSGIKYLRYDWDEKIARQASWSSKSMGEADLARSTGFLLDSDEIEWRWQWLGFDFGTASERDHESSDFAFNKMRFGFNQPIITKEAIGFIPYWSITIPLTVLSAFLLLTKPRKSPPNRTTEPIPAVGA